MALCSFCGTEIPHGTGKMFVKKDAKVLWFCSNKCEKNMLVLKRKPRSRAWTAEARAAKEAALAAAKKTERPAEAAQQAPAKKAAGAKRRTKGGAA